MKNILRLLLIILCLGVCSVVNAATSSSKHFVGDETFFIYYIKDMCYSTYYDSNSNTTTVYDDNKVDMGHYFVTETSPVSNYPQKITPSFFNFLNLCDKSSKYLISSSKRTPYCAKTPFLIGTLLLSPHLFLTPERTDFTAWMPLLPLPA